MYGAGQNGFVPSRSSWGHCKGCPAYDSAALLSLQEPCAPLLLWLLSPQRACGSAPPPPRRCEHVHRACCLCATYLGPLGPGPPGHGGQGSWEQELLRAQGGEQLSPWMPPPPGCSQPPDLPAPPSLAPLRWPPASSLGGLLLETAQRRPVRVGPVFSVIESVSISKTSLCLSVSRPGRVPVLVTLCGVHRRVVMV